MRAALLASALLLLGGRVHAETKPRPWAVAARTSYAVLGPAERPTGGMMLSAEASRSWPLGEATTVAIGAELSVVGFDAGARWVGILGGPAAAIHTRAWGPLGVGAAVHLDAGRLPVCSSWGLCLLYSGFFPALAASARWSPSDAVAIDLTGGARVIRTLAWSGAGGEGGISAAFRF